MDEAEYSLEVRIAYYGCFGILVFLSFFLNSLVLWITYSHKPLKSPFTALLCGISSADLLYMTFVVMFELNAYLDLQWSFGKVYCYIFTFFLFEPVIFKGIILMVLALERYINFNLIRVEYRRFNHSTAVKIILGSAFISALLSLPITISADIKDGVCNSHYSNDTAVRSLVDSVVIIASHIIPLVFLLFSTISIIYASRGQLNTSTDKNYLENRKKLFRSSLTFIVMFIIGLISWMPYTTVLLLVFQQKISVSFHTLMIIYGLKLSSSVTFPIIYFKFHKRFCLRLLTRCVSADKEIYIIQEKPSASKESIENEKSEMILQDKVLKLFNEAL